MLRGRAGGEIPIALLLLLALRTRPFQVPDNQWLYASDCVCIEPEGSHHFRQLICGVVAAPNEFVELMGDTPRSRAIRANSPASHEHNSAISRLFRNHRANKSMAAATLG
jgi:hypothetical protein